MPTGTDLLNLAKSRLNEKYENVLVPKNNRDWHGPWDCAEFASWVVYQTVGNLYGCTNNNDNPAAAEAYSGSWVRDATNGALEASDQKAANVTPGVILIRKPPMAGKMGHVAISDGNGGTVEAAGKGLGVRIGKIEGRLWHYFALIPKISYVANDVAIKSKPLPLLLQLEEPYLNSALVGRVQQALKAAGYHPGKIDNTYGPNTVAAVFAYQKSNKLIADGVVGPRTAKSLGIVWPT